MNEIKHAPGTFCWVELTTTDVGGAKSFYTDLMGWEAEDDPIPGGGVYTMLRVGKKNLGGLYQMNEEMKGVPPNWLLYVSVESAAEAAAKCRLASEHRLIPPYQREELSDACPRLTEKFRMNAQPDDTLFVGLHLAFEVLKAINTDSMASDFFKDGRLRKLLQLRQSLQVRL